MMTEWLIWSLEHQAWWRHGSMGYTTVTSLAGRYSPEQADAIVTKANRYIRPGQSPNEVALPAPSRAIVMWDEREARRSTRADA